MKQLISVNPYTGKEISRVNELDDNALEAALKLSGKVFADYKKSSFASRREKMMMVAELLKQNRAVYAKLISSEMGKLLSEAEAEVVKCAWVCEYYADHAEDFLKGREEKSDAEKSYILYEPIGSVLAIMPWNFPFWQVFRFAAPTLMAGNTALLKHASNVQGCAQSIEKLFLEAGFEHGVFQNLTISAAKVQQVIASPVVKAVTLTGSEAAGSAVAGLTGKYLKKSVLELGGNNAFVVLKDADLDLAVKIALTARLLNSGQSCIAAKRFVLEEEIHDAFVSKLLSAIEILRMGNPLENETDIAPLFSTAQADEIEQQVNESIEKGAILKCGGVKNGAFFSPTLLTEVKPEMPVFNQETFGPVFAVCKAENTEHALALSNHSDFGLGIQVFTKSEISASFFIQNAEEGAVFINGLVKSDPRLPFGGVKKSGYGRELSREGILEFVNVKTVWRG